MVVPVQIVKSAPLDKVCLLGCGISTGYGAAINTAKVGYCFLREELDTSIIAILFCKQYPLRYHAREPLQLHIHQPRELRKCLGLELFCTLVSCIVNVGSTGLRTADRSMDTEEQSIMCCLTVPVTHSRYMRSSAQCV